MHTIAEIIIEFFSKSIEGTMLGLHHSVVEMGSEGRQCLAAFSNTELWS